MKIHQLILFSASFATGAFGKGVPNHAIANLVLGQQDFVSGAIGSPDSSFSLHLCGSVVVDPVSGKVFVADRTNNRVLRFASANSLSNGAGAEAVFGQSSFGTDTFSTSQEGMDSPRSVALDRRGRLWVADRGNNRVLMFEAAVYRNTFAYADRVFGQPNFVTSTSGSTASKMNGPQGVFVDTADRLWVADDTNNRVLRFDSVSTKASGAAANGVLGQVLFTTSSSGAGAAGFDSPTHAVLSASGTLFVADSGNERVLRFENAVTMSNGAAATGVLGQPDFATTTVGLSATKMDFPTGVWSTPDDSLWVYLADQSRILRFDNASTTPSGSAASGVVGQPNFTTGTANTSNRGFQSGFFTQPFVDTAGNLWAPDPDNARVLRFPQDVTKPNLVVNQTPKSVTKKKLTIKGSSSDAFGISKVQYQVGKSAVKSANGTTSWKFRTALAKGKNKIRIWAIDSVDNRSLKTVKVRRK